VAPGTTDGIPGVRSDVAGENSGECSIAVVVIQKVLLAGSIRHKQVKISIVVVIAPRASHRNSSVGHDPSGGDFRECSVAVVSVEEIIAAIVAHKHVQSAIVIVIAPGSADRVGDIGDDVAGRDLGEGPIPIIVIEKILRAIIGDEKIQKAIIVIVAPGAAFGLRKIGRDDARGNFRECAITVIVVESIALAAPVGNEQVQKSVVVVISPTASN